MSPPDLPNSLQTQVVHVPTPRASSLPNSLRSLAEGWERKKAGADKESPRGERENNNNNSG